VSPIDELALLLPPGPATSDLPGHEQHKAGLLRAIAAGRRGGPQLAPRSPAVRRWLMPAAAAAAVALIVAVSLAVPGLSGGAPRPAARPGQPPAAAQGAPAGSALTVTRHWTVPAAGIRRVAISDSDGLVTVAGTAATAITVTAAPDYQHTAPVVSSQVSNGTLLVTLRCPAKVSQRCSGGLRLSVPAGLPVLAQSDRGGISLSGLTGDARATTAQGNVTMTRLTGHVTATASQGDITLTDLAGQITARTALGDLRLSVISGSMTGSTSQGSVAASGLSAGHVSLSSRQGPVSLSFLTAPSLVSASSQQGPVTIRLPGTASYDVTARTKLGRTSVTVPRSARSPHIIRASSQLGSVTVSG
jgi:hypothetical protein